VVCDCDWSFLQRIQREIAIAIMEMCCCLLLLLQEEVVLKL
jgi:hypothetical protein